MPTPKSIPKNLIRSSRRQSDFFERARLRASPHPALLWHAREGGSRFRQDFALGRKPMLIGLAVDAAVRGPELVSSLANAVLQTSEIAPSAMPGLRINGMHPSPHLQNRMS